MIRTDPPTTVSAEEKKKGQARWDELWTCYSPEAVADLLRKNKITGKTLDPHHCPVAEFLGRGSIVTQYKVRLPGYLHFLGTSRHLHEFLRQLDSRYYSDFDDLLTDYTPE